MRKRFVILCSALALAGGAGVWGLPKLCLYHWVGAAQVQHGPSPVVEIPDGILERKSTDKAADKLNPMPPGSRKVPFNGSHYYLVPQASTCD